MRRKDREIKDFNEMIQVIRKCDSCVIALNDEDFPYVVPLNFGMQIEDGQLYLYFHCAKEGKKVELIQKDPRVSFEMDCDHVFLLSETSMNCTMAYASIVGQGIMQIVPEEEKIEALNILMRQYHAQDFDWNKKLLPITTVLKMKVLQMSGKRRMPTIE